MNRLKKLFILLIISLSVYLIYYFTNNNSLTYLALGDGLAMGENTYGGTTYSYNQHFKDYLDKNEKPGLYIDQYNSKTKNINSLYNDILKDKKVTINNNTYTLKRLLQEADIITISIGLNDVIYEYNIKNKPYLSSYEEDKIIKFITTNYEALLKEIRRYTKRKIYLIGYPYHNTKYDKLITKLNNYFQQLSLNNANIIYINSKILLDDSCYDKNNTLFPNSKGYEKIAENLKIQYKSHK